MLTSILSFYMYMSTYNISLIKLHFSPSTKLNSCVRNLFALCHLHLFKISITLVYNTCIRRFVITVYWLKFNLNIHYKINTDYSIQQYFIIYVKKEKFELNSYYKCEYLKIYFGTLNYNWSFNLQILETRFIDVFKLILFKDLILFFGFY